MPVSIDFDAETGGQAKINYSVPLPGQISGKRIVRLDLGLQTADYLESAVNEGVKFAEVAGVSKSSSGVDVDERKARNFLRTRLTKLGHDPESVDRALSVLPQLLSGRTEERILFRRRGPAVSTEPADLAPVLDGVVVDPVLGDPLDAIREFASNALLGKVVVPGKTPAGGGDVEEVPEVEDPDPQLFLVEVYGVSSFLGDYGMGRTIRTFTLLPGEATTIRLKTWQSTKESKKLSSSIIDSHEQSAKERFADKVQNETTDKRTKTKNKKWAVEAEASASWGFGSASVTASAEGEYHSGREQFAKTVSESVGEHARDASSKRELSVSSTTETSVEIGEETSVEREINNVNVRRVLNFVFRELNQTYTTKLHLTNIHVAYTNGLGDTWRQVPISGLRGFLQEVLQPARIDEVASRILKVAATVFSSGDVPVRVLETVTYDPAADTSTREPLALQPDGSITAPTATRYYRFRSGPLGQDNDEHPVDGVLLSEQTIVMRTESAIVEALLGEADALDSYAMEIQVAAARKETLANAREELLQATLSAIADPQERAEAAAKLFTAHGEDDNG